MCPVVSLFVLIVHAFWFCAPFFCLPTGGGSKIRLPKKTGAINLNLSTLIFLGGMKWTRPVAWYGLGELIESNLEWSSQIKTYLGNHILSKIRKNIYLICTTNNWSKYLDSNRQSFFNDFIPETALQTWIEFLFFYHKQKKEMGRLSKPYRKLKGVLFGAPQAEACLRTQPNISNGVFLR